MNPFPPFCRMLALLLCCWISSSAAAQYKSCGSPQAAFDIQAVGLQPPDVVPPGGTLQLVIDVLNKQPSVTAGSATVKVYYYGWWVLTASGGMCEAPASSATGASTAHRRALLRASSSSTWFSSTRWPALSDDTCVLPGGPLQLHHQAALPAIAPRGNYRMQLSATDAANGQELFCVDVWFRVAS